MTFVLFVSFYEKRCQQTRGTSKLVCPKQPQQTQFKFTDLWHFFPPPPLTLLFLRKFRCK